MSCSVSLPTGIRKRGNVYQWSKQVDGVRIYGTSATLKQAVKDRNTKTQVEDIKIKDNCTVSLNEMVDLMNQHYETYTENTSQSAAYAYKYWLSVLGEDCCISAINTKLIDTYINQMLTTLAKGTVLLRLTYLSKLLKTARDYDYIHTIPVIHWPAKPKGRIRFFTEDEERMILANMPTEEDKWIVSILIDTGMRKSECLNLTTENIDIKNNLIRLWKTKGDKPRIIPMTERVREIVTNLISQDTDKLFPNMKSTKFEDHWDRMKALAGYKDDKEFVIHVCRHTCASRLIQKGVSIAVIQKWLGHTSINTTMRYAHLTDDGLFEALEVLEA
jgi:integrase